MKGLSPEVSGSFRNGAAVRYFAPSEILRLLTIVSQFGDGDRLPAEIARLAGCPQELFAMPPSNAMRLLRRDRRAAAMLMLISELCFNDSCDYFRKQASVTSYREAVRLFSMIFLQRPAERFAAALLDKDSRLTGSLFLSQEGNSNSVSFPLSEVVRAALRSDAASVIISHNHPHGSPEPSPEDVFTTKRLSSALSCFDAKLIDHIIIGGTSVYSMRSSEKYRGLFAENVSYDDQLTNS